MNAPARAIITTAAVLIGGFSGCVSPVPTATPPSTPVEMASPEPSPTQPPATPNGTISIGCFLAVQSIVDAFRHLDAQITELPAFEQGNVLGPYTEITQGTVVGAPIGCFSTDELAAFEAFWAYAETTRPRDLTRARIDELLAAVGIPYPTPYP